MKEVRDRKDVVNGRLYFICTKLPMGVTEYYSEWKNGKKAFSSKPGIALQYEGCDKLRDLVEAGKFFLVEVPSDADKRWRRR